MFGRVKMLEARVKDLESRLRYIEGGHGPYAGYMIRVNYGDGVTDAHCVSLRKVVEGLIDVVGLEYKRGEPARIVKAEKSDD